MGKRAKATYTVTAKDKTAAALKRIRANFKKTGQQVAGMGKSMSLGLTAPILAFGALSLKAAGDFETSMNRVKAITDEKDPLKLMAMADQAKELGRTTQFSASEAGNAMGFLAQAGFKTNEILGAMPSTLQLAAAAQIDLGRAADISSNIMTGFGIAVEDLGHANDVLVRATNTSNTNLEQLGEAMAYVAPVASAMGMSIEETTAALGLLGNAGIQGSMAGTTLRGALAALAAPSEEAGRLLYQLGVNAKDSSGNLLPMDNILNQLAISGISAGEMMTVFGKRAGPGMMALVRQGSGALRTMTEDLKDSGGTAADVAKTQMEGFNGAIKKLRSAFEGLQIALMESGVMSWMTNFITRVAGWMSIASGASKETKGLALKILGIAAAIGPVLFIVGKLAAGIAMLSNPIGWVIIGIGLLTAAWLRWGHQVKKAVTPVVNFIGKIFNRLIGSILLDMGTLLDGVGWLFEQLGKLPGQFGEDMRATGASLDGWSEDLKATAFELYETNDGAKIFKATLAAVASATDKATETIKSLGGSLEVTNSQTKQSTEDLDALKAKVEELGTSVDTTGGKLLGIAGFFQNVGDSVVDYQVKMRAAREAQARLALAGQAAMGTLEEAAGSAANGMVTAIGAAVFEAKNLLESLGNVAKSVFSSILGGLLKIGVGHVFPFIGALPGFAAGGNYPGGTLSVVGEKGPELFYSGNSGTIIPNKDLGGSGGGSNSVNISNLNLSLKTTLSDNPISIRRVAAMLEKELAEIGKFYGPETA